MTMNVNMIKTYADKQQILIDNVMEACSHYDDNTDLNELDFNDFCCVISILNAQKKALLIEDWFNKKLGLFRLSPSLNAGDASNTVIKNGIITPDVITYEYKFSTTNEARTLNLRQIRNWQRIDYYITGYLDYNNPEHSILLKIPKNDMNHEILKLGTPTHGTSNANSKNVNIEYSITVKLDSETMRSWVDKYSDDVLNGIMKGHKQQNEQ